MSSAPPGRYQSRLFNFLNRQSQRLGDRYDRTVRQLKVAAVWGVQILLYPMYLMVQGGLAAGRQLSQSAQAGWPQLKALTNKQPQETPPVADTPIQRVLEDINTLPLPTVEGKVIAGLVTGNVESNLTIASSQSLILNPPSPLSLLSTSVSSPSEQVVKVSQTDLTQTAQEASGGRCLIQGVATQLVTRTLVLITVDNQILDILTPQQQQKLSSKISWEVADLRRQWRLAQASARQLTQRRFSSLESQPRVLPPVRLFWHLMAWVQTSPVAIAANVFQESTLVCSTAASSSSIQLHPSLTKPKQPLALKGQEMPPQLVSQREIGSIAAPRTIAFLDRTVAELESHQLVPGTEVAFALTERTMRSLRERSQKLRQRLQTPFVTPDSHAETLDVSQPNTARIQALIYAAVDYFFGRQGSHLPGTSSQEQAAIPANSPGEAYQLSGRQPSTSLPSATQLSHLEFTDSVEPDPWLSWGDLFDNQQTAAQAQNNNRRTGKKSRLQNPQSPAQLPEAFNGKTLVRPGNSILGVIKRYLSLKPPSGQLAAPNTGEASVEPASLVVQPAKRNTPSQLRSTAPAKLKTSSSTAASSRRTKALPTKTTSTAITPPTPSSSDSHLEAAPDWIETPATPNGYVKHPLEQLLEWLDAAMLWLEEVVVKLWRWFRHGGNRR